ncbi:MAG: heterodisulfide reductase-related iron-sulfur binding cluster [Geminicoccaceae bacterium]
MQYRTDTFISSLDMRVSEIIEACTACGACADICPTVSITAVDKVAATELTAGVRDILKGQDASEASKAWAETCCSSGACLSVCEHGINPRFMLTIARRALNQHVEPEVRRVEGKAAFQKMSRGVKVISRLTSSPELLARLSPRSHPERLAPPDYVFYTGCNMLKTPHIGLLCLDVLDKLGVSYEVHGGPGSCCGILQLRPGDVENAGRQAFTTLNKFAASGASKILSWCPTCQIQFGETMLPQYRAITGTNLDISMFPVYLASRLDALREHLTIPVNKRVAIYEYAGELGVMEAVRALLDAIPGLEIVEIATSSIGYNNTSVATLGHYHQDNVTAALNEADAAKVDTFVGIYHGDHRELAGHEANRPFTIASYMELVGESMGIAVADRFKQLKLMQDADAIVAASIEQIDAYGLDPEMVRDVVASDMLGE